MPRPRKPVSPFRYFNSSPEVIRLVVMMYVKLNGEMVYPWRAVDRESAVPKTAAAMLRFRQMKLLQKFASVHASSASIAISLIARPLKNAARLRWPSGMNLLPETMPTRGIRAQWDESALD